MLWSFTRTPYGRMDLIPALVIRTMPSGPVEFTPERRRNANDWTDSMIGGDPPACEDAADSDNSNILDITDGIYTLSWLFLGGPPPEAPGLECGEDPDLDDALGCETGACE